MSWWPPNWKNPYNLGLASSHWLGMPSLEEAFEAGADAMLEAKEEYIRDKIKNINGNAGDDKAFRLMILAEFIPEE